MSDTATAVEAPPSTSPPPPPKAPEVHHVGIQTRDLENSTAWYRDFFGCVPAWTLEAFSDLTLSRLPGISRLTEMVVGTARFHLFERDEVPSDPPPPRAPGVQHMCLSCDDVAELEQWRAHWEQLYDSGRYHFASTERATEIVVDDDGVHSLYLLDPNGFEFELTATAGGAS